MKPQILRRKSSEIQKTIRDPILLISIIAILGFLLVFIVYPIVKVLVGSFIDDETGRFTIGHLIDVLSRTENQGVLKNTLVLGLLAGLLSTGLAFLFAYGDVFVNIRNKKLFKLVSILPIISPPFALAMSFIMLFGQRGLVTHRLLGMQNANIYGFKGLLIVQILAFFPTAYLLLLGVLQQIDPSIDEASRNLGASRWQVFKTVVFPLCKPGLINAFLLVFIQSVADFGNVMVIGGNYNTLAAQVYMQSMGNYDIKTGTALASVLLSISILMFVIQNYWLGDKSYVTVTGKPSRERALIDDKKIKYSIEFVCSIISIFILLLYVLIPLGSLVRVWGVDNSITLDHYRYIYKMGSKFIVDTTKMALISTPITGLLAMVISFLIVRKEFIGRKSMEFISLLAMAIPGTVIGMGYIIAFNKYPIMLTGTMTIIILTFVTRNMPMGIRSGIVSLKQIDPAIEEAAQDLGANSLKVFTSVTLPLIKSAFFNGLVFSFVKSMTATSAVIFLVSARHNLLTIEIMSQVDTGRLGVASGYSTILILIVLVFVAITRYLIGKMDYRGKNLDSIGG